VAGVLYGDMSRLTAASEQTVGQALGSPMFAVELVYVSFAYSGWNTAAYMAGEFREPVRDIPRAVLAGTAIVALLYLGLNVVFLASGPMAEMAGKEEVAQIAATSLFGDRGGRIVAFMIMAGLVSTASSNIMAGPRVYEAMGLDYPALKFLSVRPAGGGPVLAIALQTGLAAAMMLTSSFDGLLKYVSITLALFAGATVLGVLILRRREPNLPRPYRTWGSPFTPVLFLALEIWMIVFTVRDAPLTGAVSVGTIVLGLILYAVVRPRS